jgi:hypothetical protein
MGSDGCTTAAHSLCMLRYAVGVRGLSRIDATSLYAMKLRRIGRFGDVDDPGLWALEGG